MTTRPCERQAAVLAAVRSDGLMAAPELMAHADGCQRCGAAIAELTLGSKLRAALAAESAPAKVLHFPAPTADPARRLDENEAAFLLSGAFETAVDPDDLDPDDRALLYAAARVSDGLDPRAPSTVTRLGLADLADVRRDPPTSRARRPVLRLVVPLLVAAAAIAATFVLRAPPADPPVASAEMEVLLRRGAALGLELALGGRRCDGLLDPAGWMFQLGLVSPCPWSPRETFLMNVRVEPDADARYIAVLARDAEGTVEVLYPEPGVTVAPLEVTRDRVSDRCRAGLCWLEGGRYKAAAGDMVVVAVFSTTPLPVHEMARSWAPWRWTGRDRLVERFELEVIE